MQKAVRALVGTMLVCAAIALASEGHGATVLASIPISKEHTVTLVEFLPGVTGTIEHLSLFDTPAVTPEVRGIGIVELYRYFAGAAASVPDSVVAADARANHRHESNVTQFVSPPTVPLPNVRPRTLAGEERDVDVLDKSEVLEFYKNHCADSDLYVLGSSYAELYEAVHTVGNWEANYFLGSDTGKATYVGAWYWNGQQWENFWGTSVRPGISTVTWRGGGSAYYFAWNIGVAGAVDVGIAATFF